MKATAPYTVRNTKPANENAAPKSTKTEAPVVENGEYGPVLIINASSKYPFRFGPKKAALIVQHIEAIKHFAGEFAAAEKE